MAFLDIKNVAVKGISACATVVSNCVSDIYMNRWGGFIESTGIKARRRTSAELTSSDLCFHAAERLIDELG